MEPRLSKMFIYAMIGLALIVGEAAGLIAGFRYWK